MRHIVAWVSGLVLVAVLVASMGTVAAQDASPAASLATLPSPLAEWAVAYSSADADRLLALYTDDALWEEVAIGLAAHGQDEIRAHLDRLYTAVPDFTVDVTNGFVAGDQKIRRYTEYWDAYQFLAQLGALPASGSAPAGTPLP
ncbi:MAG: SnoaL-like domain [Thermomicrobiales bacterium]|nr:SnoaL-like domain [Thermomicrobiales bacterium]